VIAVVGIYLFTWRRAQPASFARGGDASGSADHAIDDGRHASRPVISPDGKYVAYLRRSQLTGGGATSPASVWIRQVATASNVQIVAAEPQTGIAGLTVTPDGNYVDYVRVDASGPALWRVSFLGGTPKKIVEKTDSAVGWSPDGRHMAFVRWDQGGVGRVDGRRRRRRESSRDRHAAQSRSVRPLHAVDSTDCPPRMVIGWSRHSRPWCGSRANVPRTHRVRGQQHGAEQAVPVQRAVYGLDWLDPRSLVLNQSESSVGFPNCGD
jgi:hypothetical protein